MRFRYQCADLVRIYAETHERAEGMPEEERRSLGEPPVIGDQPLDMPTLIGGGLWDDELSRRLRAVMGTLDPAGANKDTDKDTEGHVLAFSAWEGFVIGGENIFAIQPAVLDMFRHTDLGDASVDRVKLPFECFYLHFGEESRIKIGEDYVFDGAYFEHFILPPFRTKGLEESDRGHLVLTTSRPGRDYTRRDSGAAFLLGDPHIPVSLDFSATTNIATAIERAIKETLDPASPEHIPNVADRWAPDTLRACLALVANTLLFLSSEHCDVAERYPSDAPANLVRKTQQSDEPTKAERAVSKLDSLGFRRVHFVGDSYQRNSSTPAHDGSELTAAHWRRGHWRNQAHGPGFTLRKSVWILPTIVRGDLGEPEPRRIYTV